jgi:hypothetical protein
MKSAGHPDRIVINAGLEDAPHFTVAERKQIISSYAPFERDARTKGLPQLGSGRVFPVSEDKIKCDRFKIPAHWARIGGLDFGWDHFFAAAELAWNRDTDDVYVIRCYRVREATPVIHCGTLRAWGARLPWAWPRDGKRETLEGGGIALAEQYKAQGLNLLFEHAQSPDKSVSVEAAVNVHAHAHGGRTVQGV